MVQTERANDVRIEEASIPISPAESCEKYGQEPAHADRAQGVMFILLDDYGLTEDIRYVEGCPFLVVGGVSRECAQ
jgi:hypothetical protein